MATPVSAFAGFTADTPLRAHTIARRDLGPTDVAIDLQFCGVCHSDLHTVRSEWGPATYPCVPGHEMVGTVSAVGSAVKSFKVGDLAGVGCMVDSCRTCPPCQDGLEQFCEKGAVFSYGSPDKHLGGVTYGGYSTAVVCDEAFTLRIPANLDLAAAAPLLCAGITTYSPLRHWKVGPGAKVGVVGLGGLGHMALKLAKAMGAEVVLYTTSPGKEDDARRLGASDVVISKDSEAMKRHLGTLNFMINTVAAAHDLDPFLAQLRYNGTMTLVGVPAEPHPAPSALQLILKRRALAGSLIGGIKETQEMLDFCGKHNITSDIEIIPIQEINTAYERMLKSDVKYRFVIDLSSLR